MRFSPYVFIARSSASVWPAKTAKGVFQMTFVTFCRRGANRPNFSPPKSCRTTLACQRDHCNSDTLDESKASIEVSPTDGFSFSEFSAQEFAEQGRGSEMVNAVRSAADACS